MNARVFVSALLSLFLLTLADAPSVPAQAQLKINYGPNGLQQLVFGNVTLEDLNAFPSDSFQIWHMKMTDLKGNLVSTGQYGWGENNSGRTWDAAAHTWTYHFSWGSIRVGFVQNGNNLDVNVTEANNADSGMVLDGADIFPFLLHFPQLPAGFHDASYPQVAFNTTGPSVTTADYTDGQVVAVAPDASRPLYSGFWPAGNNSYRPILGSTTPDGLATFLPHNDRPVQPGQTDNFTVSLRFAASGTPTTALAQDAYASWAKTWPAQLNWTDRRAIGSVYLASSPSGDIHQSGGYYNNPRRYFNDANAEHFDVTAASGLIAFQKRVLKQAAVNVDVLRRLNAQGSITWDIEGEEFPQTTSYVCEPDNIAQIAPEMESVIHDASSPYDGMKLDDAYFKTMTDAGFRVGVCIRPQHFTLHSDGTAEQAYLDNSAVAGEIIRKMKFAHDRWGATLFYIDSTVESNGAVLDAGIFQQAAQALPDSLLIPEESTPKYYAYTAPFQSLLFHGQTGTDSTIYAFYPKAFSVNLINDVDPSKLTPAVPALTTAVKAGDVLMTHGDYWQANNPTIVSIYEAAGGATPPATPPTTPPATPTQPTAPTTPTSPPTPTTPAPPAKVSILTPAGGDTVSSSMNVTAAVNVDLDAAGSYLLVDGTELGTRHVMGAPFLYPLDTTMLSNGAHTLQLWAHDTANQTWVSDTVNITVANTPSPAPPTSPVTTTPVTTPVTPPVSTAYPIALTYPATGQAISGIVSIAASITQALDAAGSYLLVDGAEYGTARVTSAPFLYAIDATLLSAGAHTLQVSAHDIANDTLLSNVVNVIVSH